MVRSIMRREDRLSRGFVIILSVTALIIGLLLYKPISGYRVQVILSDSMQPIFSAGSLVLLREYRPEEYRIGDIVSFLPPIRQAQSVTHRIVSRSVTHDVPVILTKGDANPQPDPWTLSLGEVTGKVLVSVPWLGYPVSWLKHPIGFFTVTSATFLACILPELLSLRTLRFRETD